MDKYCNSSLEKLTELTVEEMVEIDGIGETVAIAIKIILTTITIKILLKVVCN